MKSTKATDETKEQAASMTEMADAVRKNCEQALRTSLKFQEEAGRWWGSVFNPGACAHQWQEQFNSATRTANSVLPLAQKPVRELVDLAEKNSRASAELMKKALEAIQTQGVAESQAKWSEFWTSSLNTARENTETLSQIGAKVIDSWSGFIRHNIETAEARTSKAA
jgi:Phasin protein